MSRNHTAITQEFKEDLANKIVASTVQLTWMVEGKEEEAAGSSVFASYGSKHFLLTSGHTFQDNPKDEIGINLNGYWHQLTYYSEYIYHPPINAGDDDFAIFLLNDDILPKVLRQYTPIFLYQKDFRLVEYTPQLFVFLGYPLSKTRHHPVKKVIERAPYTGWMSSISNKIEYYKGGSGCDLFKFNFNRLGTTKGENRLRQPFPKMKGLSGCGLFAIRPDYSLEYDLIGVLNRQLESEGKIVGYHLSNFLPVLETMLLGQNKR